MGRFRTVRKNFYFSEDEWRKINNLVRYYGFKSTTAFVRKRLLNTVVVVENIHDKNEIINATGKIGNNINQSVAALNAIAKKVVADKKDISQAKFLAMQIQNQQKELITLMKDRLYVTKEADEIDSNI